jgi:DNA-binding NtrC family response regulator
MPDRIVIIEDDDATRYAFERVLKAAGYRTCAFANYFAAAQILDSGGGALLVLDISLPTGTPHGVSVAMMARTQRPDLPIVFVTGFPDLAQWIDADLGPVLVKPVDGDTLVSAVRQHVRV